MEPFREQIKENESLYLLLCRQKNKERDWTKLKEKADLNSFGLTQTLYRLQSCRNLQLGQLYGKKKKKKSDRMFFHI